MLPWTFDLRLAPPRIDYYTALAWIASQTPPGALIIEAGTFEGRGASALSCRGAKLVHTYDPGNWTHHDSRFYTFHQANALDAPIELVSAASLYYLDVDPHDGAQEPQLLADILAKGFRGLLVCDDIYGTPGMKRWWASVTLPKCDDNLRFHGGQGIGFVACSPDLTLIEFPKT